MPALGNLGLTLGLGWDAVHERLTGANVFLHEPRAVQQRDAAGNVTGFLPNPGIVAVSTGTHVTYSLEEDRGFSKHREDLNLSPSLSMQVCVSQCDSQIPSHHIESCVYGPGPQAPGTTGTHTGRPALAQVVGSVVGGLSHGCFVLPVHGRRTGCEWLRFVHQGCVRQLQHCAAYLHMDQPISHRAPGNRLQVGGIQLLYYLGGGGGPSGQETTGGCSHWHWQWVQECTSSHVLLKVAAHLSR
jgi:hypothetical protein